MVGAAVASVNEGLGTEMLPAEPTPREIGTPQQLLHAACFQIHSAVSPSTMLLSANLTEVLTVWSMKTQNTDHARWSLVFSAAVVSIAAVLSIQVC